MTSTDLYQQAKDRVAQAHPNKYETWDELVADHAESHSWVAVTELQDLAALYAIEEARKDSYKLLEVEKDNAYSAGHSVGYEQGYESGKQSRK